MDRRTFSDAIETILKLGHGITSTLPLLALALRQTLGLSAPTAPATPSALIGLIHEIARRVLQPRPRASGIFLFFKGKSPCKHFIESFLGQSLVVCWGGLKRVRRRWRWRRGRRDEGGVTHSEEHVGGAIMITAHSIEHGEAKRIG